MCTIPPPPPPPPPPLPPRRLDSPNYNNDADYIDLDNIEISPEVCGWALHERSLWHACAMREICVSRPPYLYRYKNYKPIMQVGPTCGLVALSMMLKGEVSPEQLLNITKLAGFSNNGEMLSCKDMVKLVEKAISLVRADNVTCTLKEGGLYTQEIIQELLDGALLLVPYDTDCTHYPCEKNGHTAHWAFVSGVLILREPANNDFTSIPQNVYILSRHGKSRFLSAWLLEDLDKSNRNLWEFSPKKREDGLVYVIPEGGIGGENGLRNKFILCKGL